MAYWRFDTARLREARLGKGWSLAALARRTGLKPQTLSSIETHHRACRERSARAIAAALEVPLAELAAPYTVADRPTPRQLPVESSPEADDFEKLEALCRWLAGLGFQLSRAPADRHEREALDLSDAAALVHAFVDIRKHGDQMQLIGFEAFLEYSSRGEEHYAISTFTPKRRATLAETLEDFNRDMGVLTACPPGVRAAAIAVAEWIRCQEETVR